MLSTWSQSWDGGERSSQPSPSCLDFKLAWPDHEQQSQNPVLDTEYGLRTSHWHSPAPATIAQAGDTGQLLTTRTGPAHVGRRGNRPTTPGVLIARMTSPGGCSGHCQQQFSPASTRATIAITIGSSTDSSGLGTSRCYRITLPPDPDSWGLSPIPFLYGINPFSLCT